MSLRANRLGIRSIRAAMESLGVNKHDDVNDDTPREFDPNAGKKPEEIETVKKVGEIETAEAPKPSDIISQEDLENNTDPAQAEAAKQGTEETGELAGGVSEAGDAAIVNEAQGPEAVEKHTEAVTGEEPTTAPTEPTDGEDDGVTAAIEQGEVTTDAEQAAQTGEVALTPDPADPVETNDNEGQRALVETQTNPEEPVSEEATVLEPQEQDPVVDQIDEVLVDESDDAATPESLKQDDIVLEQSIESLSSDLRLLTKMSRKSGSMESYAAEAITDTIAEKFGKFWEWIKTQMRRLSAYIKALFERAIGRINVGAEKTAVALLKQVAVSKLDPEQVKKVQESQRFKSIVATLNGQQADNPAFDFVTRGDTAAIDELIKSFEAIAKHQQLIVSINKILASGNPKELIEQDFFGKNAEQIASLNAATRDIFNNENKTGSKGGSITESGFMQTLTRYSRMRVSGNKATVVSRLVEAANKVRAIIPQAVSDRGINTFMRDIDNPQEMADVLQNTQMGLRNYYRLIGGISLMLKAASRAATTVLRIDAVAMELYKQAGAGKLNFGKGAAKPAEGTTEDIEDQTATGTPGVTETGETGSDPAVPEQEQAATGGDPAGDVPEQEAKEVTEDSVGVITDPSTEMDEPIEAYNQTMEDVEEAIADLGFVEREIKRVKDSLEEGGLTSTEAERLEDSMEGIAKRHKLSFRVKMPSMESFQAGPATRLRNTQHTLEGLEEFWEKLKEVIIKAAQYVSKLFEDGYHKTLELATNLRKDFAQLKQELAQTEFVPGAQTTLESAALAKRLVVGDAIPSDYLGTLKTVAALAVQMGNGSTDIRNGEFIRKVARAANTGEGRPTELAESLLGVSKMNLLKPATDSDGNIEYVSSVLFGNKEVKVVIPDADWSDLDISKLVAGVVDAQAGSASVGTTVNLPGKADALAIANYGKTLDEAMQNMRVRASELKQIAVKARAMAERRDEKQVIKVSDTPARIVGFTNRLVGLAGQPMLDYNRYLILLGRDLSALLRATIKAQKAGSKQTSAEGEAQAA